MTEPTSCIVVKKHNDTDITKDFKEVTKWLKDKGIKVYIQKAVHDNEGFDEYEPFDINKMGEKVDFMVVLGGDGTLLYLASLFQDQVSIPPVISFARGSLGFLTPFEFTDYKEILTQIMRPKQPHWINIRMRLRAKVFRKRKQSQNNQESTVTDNQSDKKEEKEEENENNENDETENEQKSMDLGYGSIYDVESDVDNIYDVVYNRQGLNEVLIERSKVSAMIMLELHVNRKKVTYVQADGLIISTPTGSTAYSVSAGGSLIAPNVPCIGLTPICPHTLSFRPVVVSDSSIIHITIPQNARASPQISLDGKAEFQLEKGDIVQIQASKFPLSTFKIQEYQHEWWGGLTTKFNWNVRELQK